MNLRFIYQNNMSDRTTNATSDKIAFKPTQLNARPKKDAEYAQATEGEFDSRAKYGIFFERHILLDYETAPHPYPSWQTYVNIGINLDYKSFGGLFCVDHYVYLEDFQIMGYQINDKTGEALISLHENKSGDLYPLALLRTN